MFIDYKGKKEHSLDDLYSRILLVFSFPFEYILSFIENKIKIQRIKRTKIIQKNMFCSG
jgi:hypothetical protein